MRIEQCHDLPAQIKLYIIVTYSNMQIVVSYIYTSLIVVSYEAYYIDVVKGCHASHAHNDS